MTRQRDVVDHVQERWAAERPELDTLAFSVVGRAIVDETAVTQYQLERELVRALTPRQQSLLSGSWRTLLVDLGICRPRRTRP